MTNELPHNVAHMLIGDNDLELNFEAESMRALVTAATAAIAEMDALYAQEEAERDELSA